MVHFNNPCVYSDSVSYCKNKSVKRSLFGIGARICRCPQDIKQCEFSKMMPKPNLVPPTGGSGLQNKPIKIQIEFVQ